jgi:uncharacterized repeat protein (TIGR01451 family)
MSVRQKAFVLGLLCVAGAEAATPPNTVILNTATASYSVTNGVGTTPMSVQGSIASTTAACSTVGIKVELLQYIPPARASQASIHAVSEWVQSSAYSPSGSVAGPFVTLPNPTLLGTGAPATLPANLLLAPLNDAAGNIVASYSRNEPVIVRVVSYDANTDGAVADTVVVTLTTLGGDKEVVQLTETAVSSGVFVGAMPSAFAAIGAPVVQNDGKINVSAHNETITGTYTHPDCNTGASIASSSSGLIDPYGIVFNSITGAPVNGATVTLIDTATGLPAVAFCDDAVTVLPQPVVTGATTICDATMVAGGFRFPQVAAGSYRLTVTPPAGNVFPSAVPAVSLPATVGIPAGVPAILGNPGATPGGSYGGVFTLWGPALKVDIPVDAGATTMIIQKTADKTVVGTGEYVPYNLNISNNTGAALTAAQVADRLPPGFRYQKGSTRLDGTVVPDPVISADGSVLTFSMNIPASSSVVVRYVLEVTPAARTGTAENTASAIGGNTSNTGRAHVMVREDLYRNKPILIGRVIDVTPAGNAEFAAPNETRSLCDDRADNDFKGMQNARVVMQDGTYVLSDHEGRWHIDNIRAGTHVVQLDMDSLPKDYEVVSCEKNDRFAGRLYSQFVNLRGGSLWRADFHVRKKPTVATRLIQTLAARAAMDDTLVSLTLDGSTEVTGYSATVMLPDYANYVAGSAKLNGATVEDPMVAGNALIFRGTARASKWQDQYEFNVQHIGPKALIQSSVRFAPPGRAAQTTPVAKLIMLNHASVSAGSEAAVTVMADDKRPAKTAMDDDPSQLVEKLPYNEMWLASTPAGNEWLHPQENFRPNLPVVKVAVKHDPKHKVALTVNGEVADVLSYDGAQINAARTVALSNWRGIVVHEGDNRFEVVISDATGKEISHETRTIHYASAPDRVELLPEQSRLVADGKTRSIIAVRFLDKDGVPVRRGINGEFMLNEPYRSWDRREGIEREPLAGRIGGKARYEVKTDGIAMIELEPTTQTGEAVLGFQFNDGRKQELRAWLEPGQRDWILVGFAEGTVGHKTLSGNVQALKASGVDEQIFDGNKVAFYAKGSIKGEYLLTAAYDTAKQVGNPMLKQAIDPTQYYTLYSDATQAQHDAASSSRLYVKLERKQFYAMFGDYDTGLTVTELSRYSRTVNGVKSEFKGDKMGYNAFASVTPQAYVKDEIQGNGTSGVYKLSRGNLMMNSDKIRIETRDRFQSQNVVNVQTLTRYLDYDIDYYLGTLTFREPVQSRDSNFNPTWIVAEYESADPQDSKATYGGRGSFKPVKELEVGATAVHEGTVGATGNLTGFDATYKPDDKTTLRTELAATDRNRAGNVSSGNAWLGEIAHHEEVWDGKLYLRQQSGGFGVGQQAPSEIATRKMGMDGRYKLDDSTQVKGQAYRQENLTTGANNLVLDGRVDEKISEVLSAYYGARVARDTNTVGNSQSNQLLAGAAYTTLDRKLTMRAAGELSAGTAGSYVMPNRLILGSDYKLTEQTKAFAEQEFARGEKIAANTTRVGLRTQPWQGAEMSASVANNFNNDAERMYANMGMVQNWQIDEHWQTNFSVDRSQTIRNTVAPTNLNTPLPSGTMPPAAGYTGDFTSFAVGGGYNDTLWSANGRVEIRRANLGNQQNLQLGMQRNLEEGRSMAAGYILRQADGAAFSTRSGDLRLSYAYRPNDSEWVWLNRADYITQNTNTAGGSLKGDKLVNNFNANWMPNRRTQIALQYGAKYVLDTIDNTDYSGYTDLIGVEVRRDLNQDWDIGAFGSTMRSWNSGVNSHGVGASVGYKVMDNMWVAAGYNLRGMNDRDFANATYRGQGPFITLRMKVDQDTFGLNNDGTRTGPLSGE